MRLDEVAPAHYQSQGGTTVAITAAEAEAEAALRAELHKGAAAKKRREKRDKNIRKVGSIIGRASRSFLCEHSPAENSRSGSIPKRNLTLSPFAGPSYSVRLSAGRLTLLRTRHGIVNLDYRMMIWS